MLPRRLALPGILCAAVAAAFLLAWHSPRKGEKGKDAPGKQVVSPEENLEYPLGHNGVSPAGSRVVERQKSVRDPASEAVERYLDRVRIPLIEFDETSMEEAVDFLRLRTREIEPVGEIPLQPGYVIDRNETRETTDSSPSISFQARDLSVRQAIDEIGRQAGFRVQIREGVIHFIAAK